MKRIILPGKIPENRENELMPAENVALFSLGFVALDFSRINRSSVSHCFIRVIISRNVTSWGRVILDKFFNTSSISFCSLSNWKIKFCFWKTQLIRLCARYMVSMISWTGSVWCKRIEQKSVTWNFRYARMKSSARKICFIYKFILVNYQ